MVQNPANNLQALAGVCACAIQSLVSALVYIGTNYARFLDDSTNALSPRLIVIEIQHPQRVHDALRWIPAFTKENQTQRLVARTIG